jgi:hypothetical protein
MSALASILLALASLGICGVVGSIVATRTRELAVSIAMRASRRRVVRLGLFEVVRLFMPGLVVGLIHLDHCSPDGSPGRGVKHRHGVPGLCLRCGNYNTGFALGQRSLCTPRGVGRSHGCHAVPVEFGSDMFPKLRPVGYLANLGVDSLVRRDSNI